jgi:hypothetical protein
MSVSLELRNLLVSHGESGLMLRGRDTFALV